MGMRAGLRRHRRGGARHRSAQSRSRHSCGSAERSGGAAASLRPHRPRRPQGRQRRAGAAVARGAARNDAAARPASTRCGAAAPQAEEIRKLDQQRMMQDPLFTEEPTEDDLMPWRARCSPSARPRPSPRRWRGFIARGCRRPRRFSIRVRIVSGIASPIAATIAAAAAHSRPSRRRP